MLRCFSDEERLNSSPLYPSAPLLYRFKNKGSAVLHTNCTDKKTDIQRPFFFRVQHLEIILKIFEMNCYSERQDV